MQRKKEECKMGFDFEDILGDVRLASSMLK